ncbi:hypothetical protein BB560_003230 [Smittium megazygosporum]|uniref:Uncharacterized protein n=1 Tax=Smittium megazygosporum TaxID=133381 RepID=A0A2T9ZCP3_9FUNG|nr:hypothetical protein BB560_003230 [Smittium megazygosporum]
MNSDLKAIKDRMVFLKKASSMFFTKSPELSSILGFNLVELMEEAVMNIQDNNPKDSFFSNLTGPSLDNRNINSYFDNETVFQNCSRCGTLLVPYFSKFRVRQSKSDRKANPKLKKKLEMKTKKKHGSSKSRETKTKITTSKPSLDITELGTKTVIHITCSKCNFINVMPGSSKFSASVNSAQRSIAEDEINQREKLGDKALELLKRAEEESLSKKGLNADLNIHRELTPLEKRALLLKKQKKATNESGKNTIGNIYTENNRDSRLEKTTKDNSVDLLSSNASLETAGDKLSEEGPTLQNPSQTVDKSNRPSIEVVNEALELEIPTSTSSSLQIKRNPVENSAPTSKNSAISEPSSCKYLEKVKKVSNDFGKTPDQHLLQESKALSNQDSKASNKDPTTSQINKSIPANSKKIPSKNQQHNDLKKANSVPNLQGISTKKPPPHTNTSNQKGSKRYEQKVINKNIPPISNNDKTPQSLNKKRKSAKTLQDLLKRKKTDQNKKDSEQGSKYSLTDFLNSL